MGKNNLGEFEELVLLTIGILHDHAYGVAIKDDLVNRTSRKVSVGALQTALKRMEKKGFLTSSFGEATAIRGGKRKKYYRLTALGSHVLEDSQKLRNSMWNAIPSIALKH